MTIKTAIDIDTITDEELDVRASALTLTTVAGLSAVGAAEVVDIPRANFIRLSQTGKKGRQDVAGLNKAVIDVTFATASGFAAQAQHAERELRIGENGALVRGRDLVQRAKSCRELSDLDILSLESLQLQIAIYEAKEGVEEERLSRLQRAYRIAQQFLDDALRAFIVEETGENAERIIALRAIGNAYFVAWELDEAEGITDGSGTRVQATVKDLAEPSLYRQTGYLAAKLLDPRLSYQVADIAAMAGDFYASARLLKQAIEITNQDSSHPRAWEANWLHTHPTEERHFEEVVAILESPLFC